MRKIVLLSLICVICFLICVISVWAQEEKITLTTYYPAPYGVYDELKSRQMWIGFDDNNQPLSGGKSLLQVGDVTEYWTICYLCKISSHIH